MTVTSNLPKQTGDNSRRMEVLVFPTSSLDLGFAQLLYRRLGTDR